MAYELTLPDKPANPLRVKPPEGEMMAVMRANGPLDRIVASVTGWHFRNEEPGFVPTNEWEGWDLLPDIDPAGVRPQFTPPQKSMPEAEFGIIVVGFLRSLYTPHMRYTKWELQAGKTEPGLVIKDRKDSPFFFFQYNMAIPVLEVESRGNFKTTIKMNVVIRMTNPYKAQFLAGGWESLLDAAVHGAVRDHISDLTVDEIRQEQESGGLIQQIKLLNNDRLGPASEEGFRSKFGIEIIDVRFVGFEIVGSEKVQDALEAREVNRLLARAARQKAREIETISMAEGQAAARVVAGYGGNTFAAAGVAIAKAITEALLNKKK